MQVLMLMLVFLGLKNRIIAQKECFSKVSILILSGFALVWGIIALTGIGIVPDDRYWKGVGIPLLNEQIVISVLVSFSAIYVVRKYPKLLRYKDGLIFVLLWGFAAFFWIKEPLPRNFFAVGPYPPTNQLFPYADSLVFDLGGQFGLIGEGLWAGKFIDRGLLSGLLAIFYLIVGQSYEKVVFLQTLLFSVFPAFLYLVGRRLHSRLLGVSLGTLFIFKGINAIASSTLILSVHPKYFLTEFATAILLAIFVLGVIRWYQEKRVYHAVVLAGAALGVGVMLRTHLMVFFVLVFILVMLKYWREWRKSATVFLLFIAVFLVTISPWMWRSHQVGGRAFFFLSSFDGVMGHRYSSESLDVDAEESAPNKEDASAINNVPLRAYSPQYGNKPMNTIAEEYPFSNSFVLIVANHFTHNMITSFLMIPTTPIFHDLDHIIRAYPYWGKLDGKWDDGRLSLASKIGVFWNLFLLSVGISVLWKKNGIAALIPLLLFLFYHAANAVARTSGGRYLVPVDWVPIFYYLAGLLQLIFFFLDFSKKGSDKGVFSSQHVMKPPFSIGKSIFTIAPFFMLILSITLIDQLTPKRYPSLSTEQIVHSYLTDTPNIPGNKLEHFVAQPDAQVLLGRGLYPRFYGAGQGEPLPIYPAFEIRDYSRLTLMVIGDHGEMDVVLPADKVPKGFPNAADIVVLGCKLPGDEYLMGQVIVVLDGDSVQTFWASGVDELSCE